MKILILILLLFIGTPSISLSNGYQYREHPSPYVILRAHQRILFLRDQLFRYQQLMKYNRATQYQIALYNKILQEHNYLVRKFGNPNR